MNQEAGRRGTAKGKNSKVTQSNVTRAKLHSSDTTTHARGDHPLANSRSPSSLWLLKSHEKFYRVVGHR